jgi:hypothetical protein
MSVGGGGRPLPAVELLINQAQGESRDWVHSSFHACSQCKNNEPSEIKNMQEDTFVLPAKDEYIQMK